MHDHLSPRHEHPIPPVSLVKEAYDGIIEHNRGVSPFKDLVLAIIATNKAEAAEVDSGSLEEALSDQTSKNRIKADIQCLRHAEILGNAGVRLADGGGSMAMIGSSSETMVGDGIQIDEAAQINIPEALSKRYQKLEDEGYHKFCNTYGEFIEAKEAMGVYKDLKDAVTYYTQNVLPEFVFLGDADDERLLEPWPYVDAGIENVIMRITNEAVQVIQANHSPEALAYAQRYANNFEVGLIKTLDYLREFPDEDCQNCWLGDGETERTYSSIVQECLDKLRRAKDDAKINEQFNQIIDGLRW